MLKKRDACLWLNGERAILCEWILVSIEERPRPDQLNSIPSHDLRSQTLHVPEAGIRQTIVEIFV